MLYGMARRNALLTETINNQLPERRKPKQRPLAHPGNGLSEQRDERTRTIMRLMTSGQWSSARCVPELATQWNVTESSVQRYVGEATRRVKDLAMSSADAYAVSTAVLDEILNRCMASGDHRAALEALKLATSLQGHASHSNADTPTVRVQFVGPDEPLTIDTASE